MPTLYSKGTGGNWSTLGTFNTLADGTGTDTVPANTDDVIIQKNDTVTINDTTCVALTVTLQIGTTSGDVGAILNSSTTANSRLTVERGIDSPGSSTANYATTLDFDKRSYASYTTDIVLNNSAATGAGYGITAAGNYVFRGTNKRAWTTIQSALTADVTKSVVVDDATGWLVGDKLIFATTSAYNATPRIDIVSIATITPGSGTTATVTWTDGTGATGAVQYAHASGCIVGNFTRNLCIRPPSAGGIAWLNCNASSTSGPTNCYLDDIEFRQNKAGSSVYRVLQIVSNSRLQSMSGNAFYDMRSNTVSMTGLAHIFTRDYNLFYSTVEAAFIINSDANKTITIGPDRYYAVFGVVSFGNVISNLYPDQHQIGHKISGVSTSAGTTYGNMINTTNPGIRFEDCDIWSCNSGISNTITTELVGCRFGSKVFAGCDNTNNIYTGNGIVTATDCEFPTTEGRGGAVTTLPSARLKIVNRDANPAVQEIYGPQSNTDPMVERDTSTATPSHSTSSVKLVCNGSAEVAHEFQILAKAGEKMRLQGWFLRGASFTSGTYPTVSLYVAGVLKETQTLTAAVSEWERWVLDLEAVDAPSSDGLVTVKFSQTCTVAGAYGLFSGCPVAPFVTRRRHYGYTLDETNPVCTREYTATLSASVPAYPTIAELNTAELTVAAAIGGITISWGATSSITAFTASRTFQQLWDYVLAKGCENSGSAMPITAAGVAGNVALFAQGNITVNQAGAYDLNGAGSLDMGGHTLTYEFGGGKNFTYTGGAFSQAAARPSFSGGTLTLSEVIAAADNSDVFDITSSAGVKFGAASASWDLSDCTFTGTITLTTTGALSVTVLLPAGTTVDNQEAGNITVNYTSVTRGLDFSGVVADSTVRIFNTGTTTLRNAPTGPDWIWSEAGGSDVTVDYTICKVGYDFIHVTGVTVNSAVLDVPVQQAVDRSYVASSGLSGANAAVDTGNKYLKCDLATTPQNFYAYMLEQWITQGGNGGALANLTFPIKPNGPNSFTLLDGWETRGFTVAGAGIANTTLDNFYGDGLRYEDGGTTTAQWAAIKTTATPAGTQVRYQQSDAGTTVDAANTGNMNQLVQIYGDASHGNFDKRGYLVVKAQRDGYDQAEVDVVSIYGTLEDQLYSFGLTPVSNSLATGNPSLATAPTITQGTYVVDGKTFSVKIVDGATANSGTMIMRWLRYNFGLGGAFQDEGSAFNYHDLVQRNGTTKFKTVNGTVYGTATTKGVLVYMNDGVTLHPDFNLFTADNGATYTPPSQANITWASALNGTTVIVYNDSQAGYMLDGGSTVSGGGGYLLPITLPHAHVAVGDTIRLRHCKIDKYADEIVGTMTADGLALLGSQATHEAYATWGIDGAACDVANGGEFSANLTTIDINIESAGSVSYSTKKRIGAWSQYLLTLPAGLDAFYGAFTCETEQIRQNVGVVDVVLRKNSAGNVAFTDNDVRYYRSDFSLPYDPTGSAIFMDYAGVPFKVATGSGVTPTDKTDIAAAVRTNLSAELGLLMDDAKSQGLVAGVPAVITPTSRTAGSVSQTITEAGGTVTVERV